MDHRTAFEADGYVVVHDLLDPAVVDELNVRVDRFLRDVVPAMPRDEVFLEDRARSQTLKQLQHMELHDPWFRAFMEEGPMRELAEHLLGGAVVPRNLQYFNKPAGDSRPTPPHQDGAYFMLEPCEAVTLWLALDAADEDNGCVRVVRRSHRQGLRPHVRTDTLGFSQAIADYPMTVTWTTRSRSSPAPGICCGTTRSPSTGPTPTAPPNAPAGRWG